MPKATRSEVIRAVWEVWGRTFLFHPNTVGADGAERWERVLIEALAVLEESGDSLDAVRFLCEKLFSPLGDPLSFARSTERSIASLAHAAPADSGEGWRYLPVSSPMKSLRNLQEIFRSDFRGTCILDFRFLDLSLPPQDMDTLCRCMSAGVDCQTPPTHRAYRGWPGLDSLTPYCVFETPSPVFSRLMWAPSSAIERAQCSATSASEFAFVVDDRVCASVAEHLAVLQNCGRGRVIWERQGTVAIPESGFSLRKPWVEVYLHAPASPWVPDFTVDRLPPEGSMLIDLVLASSEEGLPKTPAPSCPFDIRQHSPAIMRKVRRLAGWIKTCAIWRFLHPLTSSALPFWEGLLRNGLEVIDAELDDARHCEVMAHVCRGIPDGHLRFIAPPSATLNAPDEETPTPSDRPPSQIGEPPGREGAAGEIGWLSPFDLENGTQVEQALSRMTGRKGLILDLRGYPSDAGIRGSLVEGLCSTPFHSGVYEIPIASDPEIPNREFHRLQFEVTDSAASPFSGCVVALIDESVVSAAEDICLYLREAGRVTFVGRRTAGCLGNVTHIPLPDGGRVDFSGMRVLDSEGNLLSGTGIIPDIVVSDDTHSGSTDLVAEQGLEVLKSLLNGTDRTPRAFAPWLLNTRREVESASEIWRDHLESSAREELEDYLARRMTAIASPTLAVRSAARKAARMPSIFSSTSSEGVKAEPSPIGRIEHEDLREILGDYPVLAAILNQECQRWVSATSEMLDRLSKDYGDVEDLFFAGRGVGRVSHVLTGLSDPHNEGRTVAVLEFQSGDRVVYKPKSLGLDQAFSSLLRWCNERRLSVDLLPPRILSREGYGWMEYFTPRHPADREELRDYRRRAGMLLCLLHLLEASDIHVENVMGVGSHPIIIDLECLLQHRLADPDPVFMIRPRRFCGSVLRTRFLPGWRPDAAGRWWFDPGLEGPLATADTGQEHERAEDVVSGFNEMALLLARHREELAGPSGPLQHFRDQPARVIFQDTLFYVRLLEKSLHPRCLRAEAEREAVLDLVSRPLAMSGRQESHRARFAAERRMLVTLDVPHFCASTSDTVLLSQGKPIIDHCFAEPSFERAVRNIKELDSRSLQSEVELIRSSLTLERPTGVQVEAEQESPLRDAAMNGREYLLSYNELLLEAEEIGDRLLSSAIRSSEGVMWPAETILATQQGNVLGIQPTDAFLYSGGSGIGVFLAALAKQTGEQRFRTLAVETARPLVGLFKDRKALEHISRLYGIGIAEGLGSLMYGLARMGTLLEEQEFLQSAALGSTVLAEFQTESGRARRDVFGGTAGAILALLALEDDGSGRNVTQIAVELGRKCFAGPAESWIDPESQVETPIGPGFAHGLAGIGYMLLKLGEASCESEFQRAGQAAIHEENRYFSPESHNWRVAGSSRDAPVYQWAYCHGAPGIGLGRLGSVALLDSPQIRADIDVAVSSTRTATPASADHLCCGHAGRTEMMLTASDILDNPALYAEARRMASVMIREKRARGFFRLIDGRKTDTMVPGLFRGLAGLGYLALRLHHPRSLPNVLLFQ